MSKKYVDAIREANIDIEVKHCFKHPRKKKFTAIKGFGNSLVNLGYRYIQNQWIKKEGSIRLCKNGFHAVNPAWCPLAVFDFYSPCEAGFNVSRYFKVEMKEVEDCDNFKIATRKIRLAEELDLEGILMMHAAWLGSKFPLKQRMTQSSYEKIILPRSAMHFGREMLAIVDSYSLIHATTCSVIAANHHCSINVGSDATVSTLNSCLISMEGCCKLSSGCCCWIEAGDNCRITTGNDSKVIAGSHSFIIAGNSSYVKIKSGVAMTGLRGISIVGDGSVAISQDGIVKMGADSVGIVIKQNERSNSKAYFYGDIGSIFVCMPNIVVGLQTELTIVSARVDEKHILANTWYTVENGKFVKAKESFLDGII